jgi:hypothetical protein
MIGLLLRIYPAAWRARYGDEFAAMLETRHLGPYDVADVVLGAIDAHLHLRGSRAASAQRRGIAMSVRIGGGAAIIGGVLLLLGFAWAAWDPADEDPGALLILPAFAALLVGLVGLSAFQARKHPALIWAAFAVPALGILVAVVGMIGMAANGDREVVAGIRGWDLFALGGLAMIVGSALFAIATFQTRVFPRSGSALLAFGSLAAIIAGAASIAGGPAELLSAAAILGYSIGWMALGWSGVRIGQPAAGWSG